jgi:FkbM family methyltransferase
VDYHRTNVLTPRGHPAAILSRDGTSDLSLAGSMFRLWGTLEDEYHLADLTVDGAFLDIGAHAGYVALAVLLDNPQATAVCLEPIPENLDLMDANMTENGVRDRVELLQGAIGPGETMAIGYDYSGDPYARTNRYVGALSTEAGKHHRDVTVPAYTLAGLVDRAGGRADAAKLDCEGCEWTGLADPAVAAIRCIFGEWHGHILKDEDGFATVSRLLHDTHDVESLDNLGGTGVFRAVRR